MAEPIEAAEVIADGPKAMAGLTVVWPEAGPIESFTRRETEVLWLLDAGLSIEEIAAVLGISSETVERHTSRIYGEAHSPMTARASRT